MEDFYIKPILFNCLVMGRKSYELKTALRNAERNLDIIIDRLFYKMKLKEIGKSIVFQFRE